MSSGLFRLPGTSSSRGHTIDFPLQGRDGGVECVEGEKWKDLWVVGGVN